MAVAAAVAAAATAAGIEEVDDYQLHTANCQLNNGKRHRDADVPIVIGSQQKRSSQGVEK